MWDSYCVRFRPTIWQCTQTPENTVEGCFWFCLFPNWLFKVGLVIQKTYVCRVTSISWAPSILSSQAIPGHDGTCSLPEKCILYIHTHCHLLVCLRNFFHSASLSFLEVKDLRQAVKWGWSLTTSNLLKVKEWIFWNNTELCFTLAPGTHRLSDMCNCFKTSGHCAQAPNPHTALPWDCSRQ